MAQENQPVRITVVVAPDLIEKGQMVQIAVSVNDKFGTPLVVPTLYMDIIDSKGIVFWRTSLIAENVSSFAKLISTNELKHNTRYQVRIGTTRKLTPHSYTYFKTKKHIGPLAFIPLLFAPAVLTPENEVLERYQLIPKDAQVPIFLTYATELDARVCPICKPNEGLTFAINDPDVIRIGPSALGGATHWGCRCHYNIEQAVNAAVHKVEGMLKAMRMVKIVKAVKKHKALQVRY